MTVTTNISRWAYGSAVLLAASAGPAAAQPVCLARPLLLQQLQADFGKQLLWQGRRATEPDQEGPVLEIFVSPHGGSWTLVHSLPNGLSCFVAAGASWAPGLAAPAAEGRKS
jgi:hypothetical protein